MKLIHLKPNTPETRHQINLKKNLLSKSNNFSKILNFNFKNFSGRSSKTGHITVWHKGGGCKKKFRHIKFNNNETRSIILFVSYDPYRSSFISLGFDLFFKKFSFFLATQTTFPGSIITCQKKDSEFFLGNRTILKNFPIGILIHNLSLFPFKNGKITRAAGTFSQIVQKKNNKLRIRLSSGKLIMVKLTAFATFGRVSNFKHNLIVYGKAGRKRHSGIRPTVRGVATNPVDHPHGGRTKGGCPSMSPWGLLTKGKPTVKKKKYE